MERALVTGGAGFIGSNLTEKLVEDGAEVTVLDSLYLGDTDNISSVEDEVRFIDGSVLDRETVNEAVENCDTVFHLAARSSSPMHQDNPAEGVRVNVEGFVETVEAAIRENADKVVYASTSSMYGTVQPPHTEDADVLPKNRYSASKLCREQYGKCYSHRGEIQTTGLRFFSVYGPHEKPKGKYANIISQFLWKMQNGEQPVIWGDGNQERDFTYVEDVVDALIKAAETRQELDGEIVNVGTGQPHTFNEVMEALNNELGTEIDAEFVDNPRGDSYIHEHRADTSKAEKLLDWTPSNSFQDGVSKTVDYHT